MDERQNFNRKFILEINPFSRITSIFFKPEDFMHIQQNSFSLMDVLFNEYRDIFKTIALNPKILPSLIQVSKRFYLYVNQDFDHPKKLVIAQLMKKARHLCGSQLDTQMKLMAYCKVLAFFNSDLGESIQFAHTHFSLGSKDHLKAIRSIFEIAGWKSVPPEEEKIKMLADQIRNVFQPVKMIEMIQANKTAKVHTVFCKIIQQFNLQNQEEFINYARSTIDSIESHLYKAKALYALAQIHPKIFPSACLIKEAQLHLSLSIKDTTIMDPSYENSPSALTAEQMANAAEQLIRTAIKVNPDPLIEMLKAPFFDNTQLTFFKVTLLLKTAARLSPKTHEKNIQELIQKAQYYYDNLPQNYSKFYKALLLASIANACKENVKTAESFYDKAYKEALSIPAEKTRKSIVETVITHIASQFPLKAHALISLENNPTHKVQAIILEKLAQHKPKQAIDELIQLLDCDFKITTLCTIAGILSKISSTAFFPFYEAILLHHE